MSTNSNDKGFMVRDGHPLKWDRTSFSLSIFLTHDAADYLPEFEAACEGWNSVMLSRRLFARPNTNLIEALFTAFVTPAKRVFLKDFILVRIDPDAGRAWSEYGDRHIGSTDLQYDTRTGQLFNGIVTMQPRKRAIDRLGQQGVYQAVLHECGHLLGLDHDVISESVMFASVAKDATKVTGNDVVLIRNSYE